MNKKVLVGLLLGAYANQQSYASMPKLEYVKGAVSDAAQWTADSAQQLWQEHPLACKVAAAFTATAVVIGGCKVLMSKMNPSRGNSDASRQGEHFVELSEKTAGGELVPLPDFCSKSRSPESPKVQFLVTNEQGVAFLYQKDGRLFYKATASSDQKGIQITTGIDKPVYFWPIEGADLAALCTFLNALNGSNDLSLTIQSQQTALWGNPVAGSLKRALQLQQKQLTVLPADTLASNGRPAAAAAVFQPEAADDSDDSNESTDTVVAPGQARLQRFKAATVVAEGSSVAQDDPWTYWGNYVLHGQDSAVAGRIEKLLLTAYVVGYCDQRRLIKGRGDALMYDVSQKRVSMVDGSTGVSTPFFIITRLSEGDVKKLCADLQSVFLQELPNVASDEVMLRQVLVGTTGTLTVAGLFAKMEKVVSGK